VPPWRVEGLLYFYWNKGSNLVLYSQHIHIKILFRDDKVFSTEGIWGQGLCFIGSDDKYTCDVKAKQEVLLVGVMSLDPLLGYMQHKCSICLVHETNITHKATCNICWQHKNTEIF
jgi:hypothetical protein